MSNRNPLETVLNALADTARLTGIEGGMPTPVELRMAAPVKCSTAEEALDQLRTIQNWTGWWMTTGGTGFLEKRFPDAKDGGLLAAEAVNASVSVHIRRSGDSWLVTRLEETTNPDGPWLAEPASLAGTRKCPGPLCYTRYLRHDPVRGWQPAAARFIGFGKRWDRND